MAKAEAEGEVHDVKEVQRVRRQHTQFFGEKLPEETLNVWGTCLEEKDWFRRQPQQGRNQSCPWEQSGVQASPEVDGRPSWSQPSWLSKHASGIDEIFLTFRYFEDENW